MPPERYQRPRQDPASCESCRRKKLKCDRELPCANCAARGIPCSFQGRRVAASAHLSSSSPTERPSVVAELQTENALIRSRLERLEDIVLASACPREPLALESPPATLSTASENESCRALRCDYDWLLKVPTIQSRFALLSSIKFTVRIERLESIADRALRRALEDRCILLPGADVTMQLFESYKTQLDPVQHIVHIPTARDSITRLYRNLREGKEIAPNQTLITLAILASIGLHFGFTEPFHGPSAGSNVYGTAQAALHASFLFLRTSMDVLDYVCRNGKATLETLQANILISFFTYHFEGHSPRVRSFHAVAISLARDLGLHRTDAYPDAPEPKTQAAIVDKEIRRRVWWFVVATDWGLAVAGGPQEGSYNIHPHHMRVRRPRNITDEDLMTKPGDYELPAAEPTIMSYYIQRLRMCETCRQVADVAWAQDLADIPVERLMLLDQEFVKVMDDVPVFLRVDEESQQKCRHLESAHPYVVLHRFILNFFFHSRRCKLHLSSLLRAPTNPSYHASRKISLDSAREVISTRKAFSKHYPGMWLANPRLCSVLHLFFYAVVVLVMDLAINKTADADTNTRKAEVEDACRTLEHAKQQSSIAGAFLDSLMAIMHKHRIRLRNQDPEPSATGPPQYPVTEPAAAATAPNFVPPPMQGASTMQWASNTALPEQYQSQSQSQGQNQAEDFFSYDLDVDDFWRGFVDSGSDWGPQSWETLISDLDPTLETM